ncbi:type I-B CRISPR-associated protein Cas8b1/Cst1 [Thermococcus kodakarensis]|nr:type I-B CRISPR-associated protein Cas8b1/Cst1 [Thermococcus kodakarensis]WCN29177.1 type I-B CRISPR-associated protein Cas8b1/Cst1 [Thermococcus kodakarensis]WCN31481.1 type I-B CRISPR-associated protein Cas8b1/Cst1 [Thermococcus kodakarensis]
MLLLSGKKKPEELSKEDIENVVNFASRLYARKEWSSGYIHAMMLPNSGILMANPSMAKKRTPEAIKKNLLSLLNEKEDPRAPICEICGRRHARIKPVYRSDFPLVGTGGVPNYFPSGKDGANICSHCLFLAQMMPLVAYRLSRVLIIHAYPYQLMLEFHKEAIEDIKKSELASTARDFKRPENFLFEKLTEIGTKFEIGKLENASITLYYFVNNNQSQEMEVIYIPNPVLRFVAFAARVDRAGWKKIVSMGWNKGCAKRLSKKPEEIPKSCSNDVYSKLLSGGSILPYFIDFQNRKVNASWRLLSFYCSEVLGLDREALEFIKGIADRIVETVEKLPDNKLSRRIRELERAEKLYQFESFFIRVEKDRQELGIPEALMSFDDFARILTSYGEDLNVSWKTVKNLLLFRIYEKLHDRLMKASAEEVEAEENEEEFEEGGEE